jgi:hypothetical protein
MAARRPDEESILVPEVINEIVLPARSKSATRQSRSFLGVLAALSGRPKAFERLTAELYARGL